MYPNYFYSKLITSHSIRSLRVLCGKLRRGKAGRLFYTLHPATQAALLKVEQMAFTTKMSYTRVINLHTQKRRNSEEAKRRKSGLEKSQWSGYLPDQHLLREITVTRYLSFPTPPWFYLDRYLPLSITPAAPGPGRQKKPRRNVELKKTTEGQRQENEQKVGEGTNPNWQFEYSSHSIYG